MTSALQQFLVQRKFELLDKEKRATGISAIAMLAQTQMVDAILMFLSSQQREEDMAKLRLTLDKQATPVDDIKPRQENAELTDALIDLAKELDEQFHAQKDKKMIKYPLNNLPGDIKPHSVSSKIYGLRVAGKLPFTIIPKTRTVKLKETVEDLKTGEKKEVIKTKEVVYMVRIPDEMARRYEEQEKARSRNGRGV